MKVGSTVYLQIPKVFNGFANSGVIGEVVNVKGNEIVLKDTVYVLTDMGRSRTGDLVFSTQYYSDNMISSGTPAFKLEDVVWSRTIDREEERTRGLRGYFQALEGLRMERANLKTPNQIIQPGQA